MPSPIEAVDAWVAEGAGRRMARLCPKTGKIMELAETYPGGFFAELLDWPATPGVIKMAFELIERAVNRTIQPSPTEHEALAAGCRAWADAHPDTRRWSRFTSWHDGGSVFEAMDFRAPLREAKRVFTTEAGMREAFAMLEAAAERVGR